MYIHREIGTEIKPFLERKEIIAIVGPRQVGKTTFLNYLFLKLKKGKLVKYMTFEKKADLRLFESIEDFKALHEKYQLVILDEFQYAKEGGQKLKYLYDTTNTKFIISGSSSLELKYETGKYLVGRMVKFTLWPFSFGEYLSSQDKDLHDLLRKHFKNPFFGETEQAFGSEVNTRLLKIFEDYLVFGGYPAVATAKTEAEKIKLQESIFEAYLLKDIRGLLRLQAEEELIRLGRFLATQIGDLINYQELSASSGLTYKELLGHLDILKQTYIIDIIRPYFRNRRTELVKNPKVYFIDSGLRNFLLQDFRPLKNREDIGSLVENYVFSYLKRKTGITPVRFWRTKSQAEVDFIIEHDQETLPIEVKYSPKVTIGKSLYSFIEKFSPRRAYILTKGETREVKIKKTNVIFLPVYFLY